MTMNHHERKYCSSLLDLIEQANERYSERQLFAFARSGEEYTVSYGEFYSYVNAIARGMMAAGVAGCRVALLGETSVEWIATYIATVISGGEIVPLDANLDREHIAEFAVRANVRVFLAADGGHYKDVTEREGDMPCVEHFLRLTEPEFLLEPEKEADGLSKYDSLTTLVSLGIKNPELALPEQDTEKMCALLFTSGTTGSSKGVMLCQRNICSVITNSANALCQLDENDSLLSVLPVHHTYEMSCGILTPMIIGMSIAINDSLRHVSVNLKKYKPTTMTVVPLFVEQFYSSIMKSVKKKKKEIVFDLACRVSHACKLVGLNIGRSLLADVHAAFGGNLRWIICGGAAMNPKYVDIFRDLGITVMQGYGITECAPLVSVVPYDVNNPTSCGRLMEDMQIFIDRERACDAFGEIVVKGDNVMLGYFEDPEATADVLSHGWFRTGDIGYYDQNRYIYITGRKKNVIVLPDGKNVFPEEIEEYLSNIPLVTECVVVGRQDPTKGTVIVAVIYADEAAAAQLGYEDTEAVRAAIRADAEKVNRRLVGYKRIAKIEFRSEPFEKTTTKKIKRFLVK